MLRIEFHAAWSIVPAATHIIVANPDAQSGRNAARLDRALRAFEAHGIHAQLLPTLPNGQTVAMVRDATQQDGLQCIISMGGDGTLREVTQGLLESGRQESITLAMLPAGTANNHGRSFGLDATINALEKNVAIIVKGQETRLDVGRLELRTAAGPLHAMFVDSVGFGIGARVVAERNIQRRRIDGKRLLKKVYRDMHVYTMATLQMLWSASAMVDFGVTIIADGQSRTYPRLTELLVKGTRIYASRWVIDRTSKHDDGLFEVLAFPDNRRWVARGLMALVDSGSFEKTVATAGISLPVPFRASQLSLQFHVPKGLPPPAVQVDGEEFPAAEEVTIEVIPRAVRLIVPSCGEDYFLDTIF